MDTFGDVIRARREDTKEGLRFEGQSWTWDELVRAAAVRASILLTFPVKPETGQRHVGILMQNRPDFLYWLMAASLTGDVIVGINPTRRGAELTQDITHTECDLMITEDLYADELAALELPFTEQTLLNIDSPRYAELVAEHDGAALPSADFDPDRILLLLFSSGSTGAPKAVLCSHRRLGFLADSLAVRIGTHRDSVNYLCLPLFHGHAIMLSFAAAAFHGATVVMVRKFSASRFAKDLHDNQVTFFNYVGRMLSYVLNQPPSSYERDNSLEIVMGSEASPAEVDEFRERYACDDVREGYGASEGVIRINPVPGSPRHSLGLPVGGAEVEIRDPDTGEECARAEFDADGRLVNPTEATGEMVVLGRGASFEGYYKNPEAMADRLKFGGEHFWTGDLGYRDADGYFYFAGRSSDWLRVDGENFGAANVERILVRYPQFSGAHIFPVADPSTGDQVMAVATVKLDEAFDADAFSVFLGAQPDLGTKWRPTYVRIVDEVPTTGSGKINKAPLRSVAWEAPDVWYAPDRTSDYHLMTVSDRESLRAAFERNERANLLPVGEGSRV